MSTLVGQRSTQSSADKQSFSPLRPFSCVTSVGSVTVGQTRQRSTRGPDMNIDRDVLQRIATAASVEHRKPPRIVLRALASLTNRTVPIASATETIGEPGATTWRVVVLTEDDIVLVEATCPIEHWSDERDENSRTAPSALSKACAYPRSAVTHIEIAETLPIVDEWGNGTLCDWDTLWRVHFGNLKMDLPANTKRAREASELLMATLREARA